MDQNKTITLYSCSACGSTDVYLHAWVDPNGQNKFIKRVADSFDGWCNECNDVVQFNEQEVPVEPSDPWCCEKCGSLAVQDRVWIDANTQEIAVGAQHRDESYCNDCEAHTYHIRESELMLILQKWWDAAEIRTRKAVTGIAVAGFAPEDVREGFDYACDKFWEQLTNEEKIDKWNEHKNEE